MRKRGEWQRDGAAAGEPSNARRCAMQWKEAGILATRRCLGRLYGRSSTASAPAGVWCSCLSGTGWPWSELRNNSCRPNANLQEKSFIRDFLCTRKCNRKPFLGKNIPRASKQGLNYFFRLHSTTHLYKHTYANTTPMSTSEDQAGKFSRLTISP